jgi:rod shape-determining protein MreB
MVVDVGGGTTEVAVLSYGGIVTKTSIRIGGDEMDEAIDNYLKKAYNLLVGELTAETIKMEICSAFPLDEEQTMTVKGRDIVVGIPKTLKVTSKEMREAIREPVSTIIGAVISTLERTPPELAADIIENGVTMAGGGSLLKGLDQAFSKATNLSFRVAENAMTCIVLGTGKVLEEPEQFANVILPDN